MEIVIKHPGIYDSKGKPMPLGKTEVDEKLGKSLVSRGLADEYAVLEVATPKKKAK